MINLLRLVAEDRVAGRSVLRDRSHWYLLSVENGWSPLGLAHEIEALALIAHGGMRVADDTFLDWDAARLVIRDKWLRAQPPSESIPLTVFADCPREPLVLVTSRRVDAVVNFWWNSLEFERSLTEEMLEDHDGASSQASETLRIFSSRASTGDDKALEAADRFLSLAQQASRDGLTRRSKTAGSQIRDLATSFSREGWEDLRESLTRLAERLLNGGRSDEGGNESSDSGSGDTQDLDAIERERELVPDLIAD